MAPTLTLDNYVKVLSRSFYRASVANTLTIGLLATVRRRYGGATGLCHRAAEIPGKLLLVGLAALPLVLPSFVGAYALLLLLGGRALSRKLSTRGASPSGRSTARPASSRSTR